MTGADGAAGKPDTLENAMAGSRKPGAQDAWIDSVEIEDGTQCRAALPLPGPIGITPKNLKDPRTPACIGRVEAAGKFAGQLLHLSLTAIRRETGCDAGESLRDQIPVFAGLLNALQTTATISASTGPAARQRISGFRDVLAALGLSFLPQSTNQGSGELLCALTMSEGQTLVARSRDGDTDNMPKELSRGVGILTRLILQSIVEYLAKGAGNRNANRAGDLAGLLVQLRASKLGEAFAAWVAKNWTELLENPRLRFIPPAGAGASQPAARVVSQRGASPAPASTPAPEAPTFPPDLSMAAQASALIAASAQGTPFCPM